MNPTGGFPPLSPQADVRDVAEAHVLALNSPPASSVNRKRIVFASPHGCDYNAVVALIAEKRPELKERLTKSTAPPFLFDRARIDFGRIHQVLGLHINDFTAFEDTILDTVDSLLAVEKFWNAGGADISGPSVKF